MKPFRRKQKITHATAVTTYKIGDLLTQHLSSLSDIYHQRPDLILAAWPDVIGQKLAAMTEAVSFQDGVMTIKVQTSILLSLLIHDKAKIINNLRAKFPQVEFRNIMFRIG